MPSLSFGEVDIFDQVANPPDSSLRRFQNVVKKFTGISPLLPKGRGIFNYNYGILPHRRRIVQVGECITLFILLIFYNPNTTLYTSVGSPIDVERCETPDPEYVDKIHGQVIDALARMFDEYKEKYTPNSKHIKLIIQ